MSCYFRHLKDVFAEAGIEITASNKKEIDRLIHEFVGINYINYRDCPGTWKMLKPILADRQRKSELINKLSQV